MENKRPTWLLTGYVMALSFLFVAFEWTGGDGRSEAGKPFAGQVFEEELAPLVEPPAEVPLPPPPVAVPPVAEEVAVVDEEAETAPVQLLSPEDVGQGLATAGRVAERPDAGTLVADEPVVQTAEVIKHCQQIQTFRIPFLVIIASDSIIVQQVHHKLHIAHFFRPMADTAFEIFKAAALDHILPSLPRTSIFLLL